MRLTRSDFLQTESRAQALEVLKHTLQSVNQGTE